MSRPLSYVSRNSVLRHLPFQNRCRLAARCPSIRTADKKLPFTFKDVEISKSGKIRFDWMARISFKTVANGKVSIKVVRHWMLYSKKFVVDGRYEDVVEEIIKFWLDRPGTMFDDYLQVEDMRWLRNFENAPMMTNILRICSIEFVDDMFLVEARQYHLHNCNSKTASEYLDRLVEKLTSINLPFETLFYIRDKVYIWHIGLLLHKIEPFNPKDSVFTAYAFSGYECAEEITEPCRRLELGHSDVLVFIYDFGTEKFRIKLMVVSPGATAAVVWNPRFNVMRID